MSYKLLKETVIRDPLIQSNIAAVSMVTEALQCQETSKETLKQETIPTNSKRKVWYYNHVNVCTIKFISVLKTLK